MSSLLIALFKAVLAGANAALQIPNSRPVFYFYFEEKNSGLSRTNYFATSPNEFSLVKMDVKKSGREVVSSQCFWGRKRHPG